MIIGFFKLLKIICKYKLYSFDSHCSYKPLDGVRAEAMHCNPNYNFSFRLITVIFFCKLLEFILYPTRIFQKTRDEDYRIRLRNALQELGPIYIKFGQVLSTAPTLVGQEVAAELRLLQDKLPSFDVKYVKEEIYRSFETDINDLFKEFDENPISAASIAQVHKAVTTKGEIVAVKILRPGIHTQYNNDIEFLYFLARLVNKLYPKYNRLKLKSVVDIFKQTMEHELNLKLEAASASELADNFVRDDSVYIPKIYWNLTSENILTSEWIEGISLYDQVKIKEYGLSTKAIATKIGLMFFNQAFRDGFFHADLHPGNILIKKSGIIALVDFGIMGRLERKDRFIMAEILFKFFKRDYLSVAKLHLNAGYILPASDLNLFAQHCRMIYEPLIDVPFSEVIIADLLTELFKITEKFGMETQEQLILLQKTMIVVEGIGRSLTPDTNLWELAGPWINKWARKNISPRAKIIYLIRKAIDENLY